MAIIKFIRNLFAKIRKYLNKRDKNMALLEDIHIEAAGDDPTAKIESIVKQLNEWGRVLSNEDRTNLTKDDAADNRLLIGYQENGFSNGSVGGKLSQEGVDVLSATSDQLIWSTDFNSFKIAQTGTITLTKPSGSFTGTATVTHNLGYRPVVLAFEDDGSSVSPLPSYAIFTSGTDSGKIFLSYTIGIITETTVTFNVDSPSIGAGSAPEFSIDVKYYLLRETAV